MFLKSVQGNPPFSEKTPDPNTNLFSLPTPLNQYHHTNNQAGSSIFTLDIADLRILQSHWLIPFWFLTKEPEFSDRIF